MNASKHSICLCTGSPGGTQYDEKNFRRRVYDGLNVLIAMEIISRSKKEILWHGLPSGHGNVLERARAEKIGLNAQIDKQQSYLQVDMRQKRLDYAPNSIGCIVHIVQQTYHNIFCVMMIQYCGFASWQHHVVLYVSKLYCCFVAVALFAVTQHIHAYACFLCCLQLHVLDHASGAPHKD